MFPVLIVLLFISSVSAHGVIVNGVVGDMDTGRPFSIFDKDNNPIRTVEGPNPNHLEDGDYLTCGPKAKMAPGILTVNAGDQLHLQWGSIDYENKKSTGWPHNTGPIMTYFAECVNTTCDKFDHSKARFFKTQQLGKIGNTDQWYQSKIFNNNHEGELHFAHTRIPENLVAGNYLLRHEIIALHLAPKTPEFYPGCIQLKVMGNGKDGPDCLVKIPGAYHAGDSGFRDNIYGNGRYKFPGPSIPPAFGGPKNSSNCVHPSGHGNPSPTSKSSPSDVSAGDPSPTSQSSLSDVSAGDPSPTSQSSLSDVSAGDPSPTSQSSLSDVSAGDPSPTSQSSSSFSVGDPSPTSQSFPSSTMNGPPASGPSSSPSMPTPTPSSDYRIRR